MLGADFEKNRFRLFLGRLREDGQLDYLIERYLRDIKKHRIYLRPSKGPTGEKGKDIVAFETTNEISYCSYVIKAGNMNRKNLDGKYGILKQMQDAMLKHLDDRQYHDSKRTVIVVFNGRVTNNAHHSRFIIEKEMLEDKANGYLLRPINYWDLDCITDTLFPYTRDLDLLEYQNIVNEKQLLQEQINKEFVEQMEALSADNKTESITRLAEEHCRKIKRLETNYAIKFEHTGE